MTVYEPGIHSDLLLLDWYQTMAQASDGFTTDLERAFSVTMAPLAAFLTELRRCFLVYEADDSGIWFAAWFDPAMTGAYHHAWIRADRRASKGALAAMIESLYLGLQKWPVLISVTKQPSVVSAIRGLGFTTLGDIPWLFDGETATISWLDSAHFYPAVKKFERLFPDEAPDGR